MIDRRYVVLRCCRSQDGRPSCCPSCPWVGSQNPKVGHSHRPKSFHTLMIPIRRPIFAASIPYTIRYLLQSYNIDICVPCQAIPYNIFISCNLHYHFEKYHPNRRVHSIYRLAVIFTADLSLQSNSTLPLSKINPPPWGVYKFYLSVSIWFYWLYNII